MELKHMIEGLIINILRNLIYSMTVSYYFYMLLRSWRTQRQSRERCEGVD